MIAGFFPEGLELPPRTRRIRVKPATRLAAPGTTSAYAENTPEGGQALRSAWNYLRVRGEYRHDVTRILSKWELPPRTRRIP